LEIVLTNIDDEKGDVYNSLFLNIKNNIIFFNMNVHDPDFIPIAFTNDQIDTIINYPGKKTQSDCRRTTQSI
jgi:hypothetical protein